MKKRTAFVSNSSSSSFIIPNWHSIDEKRKKMILEYEDAVKAVWEASGARIVERFGGKTIEGDSVVLTPLCAVSGDSTNDPSVSRPFEFGFIEDTCQWLFKERHNDDILEMVASMDNFNMDEWLTYLGVTHYNTGETWGYFSDEDPKVDFGFIDEMVSKYSSNSPAEFTDSEDLPSSEND